MDARRRADDDGESGREEVDGVRGLRVGIDIGIGGWSGALHETAGVAAHHKAAAHHEAAAHHKAAHETEAPEAAHHETHRNCRRRVPVAWIDDAGDDADQARCLSGADGAERAVESPLKAASIAETGYLHAADAANLEAAAAEAAWEAAAETTWE